MRSAAIAMKEFLGDFTFNPQNYSVLSNLTGKPHGNTGEEIKTVMVEHIVKPVKMWQAIEHIYGEGIRKFYEFDPGKVLSKLIRQIELSDTEIISVNRLKAANKVLIKSVLKIGFIFF